MDVELNKEKPTVQGVNFVKVSVKDELPEYDGKYVVFTETSAGSENVFACSFHMKENNKPHWGCSNQIVTYWLKPI
jgi:hypothetical protein